MNARFESQKSVAALSSTLFCLKSSKVDCHKQVYLVVLWLNVFPVRNGVSKVYSPGSIVVHTKLNWKQHCKVFFGTYCKVHDEPDPSNDMMSQTHEAIAAGPTGNTQGT